jgi:hypothetical protein
LKIAHNYNKRIAAETSQNDCYLCNELGGIKSSRDNDYYNHVVFVDVDINDPDIQELIDCLPTFKKWF